MKALFNLFVILFAALVLTACSKYYINTIESTNISKDEKTGLFRYENDSLSVTYSFFGENAPVQITVFNKLTDPLYIDWSRSAIVINGKAVSYSGNKVVFDASIVGAGYKYSDGYDYAVGSINGSATLPEGVTFIPPNSVVDRIPLSITNSGFTFLPDSTYKNKEFIYPAEGPIRVRAAHFTKDNSPLSFKSYLTMYTAKEQAIKPFACQHDFYIAKSIKTGANPKNVVEYQNKSPNLFYTSKMTGYGKAMGGVTIATVLLGSAAANAGTVNNETETSR